MSRLLGLASRRHLLRHPTQLALAILGVALGVAVVVSIDVANGSAQRAFELSSAAVTGTAGQRIVGGPGGVPEGLYRKLRVERGLRQIAPVVESWIRPEEPTGRLLRLVGLDPLADGPFRPYLERLERFELDLDTFLTRPGAVLLAPETAAEMGLEVDDRFRVEAGGVSRELLLAGLLAGAPGVAPSALADLALADVATAQELLGLEGRLSRIEISREVSTEELERLAEALAPGLRLERTDDDAGTAEQMTRAFRLNLQALSLLALLCGAFLIYNTMVFAVVRRRDLLGLLRAVGTTRRQILRLILAEALVVGLLGTLLGGVGGILLGRGLVGLVTRTINDLYFAVSVRALALEPLLLLKGAVLGLAMSLAAALVPALEAASVSPRAALLRSELEERTHRLVPRFAAAGILLGLAGLGLLLVPGESLMLSFPALFALLLGLAFLTPVATVGLMRLLGPLARATLGRLGLMATRGVVASLSRTGVAIAALMMAVSVTVGVDLMIGSFRSTVTHWLEYALPADLFVSYPTSVARRFAGLQTTFDPEVVSRLRALPDVVGINTLRHFETDTSVGVAQAVALDLEELGESAFRFAAGEPDRIWREVRAGEAVIVSEPFAYRHGLEVGSRFRIDSPGGPLETRIAGVFYGYATERGLFMLGAGTYRRMWGDPELTAMSIHLGPGADPADLRQAVRELLGADSRAGIRSHQELRRDSMAIFDRTFLITGVLKTLAVLVAFVGVVSALMALAFERGRELAVLRACGLTPGELWRVVIQQTGLMGLTAGLLALPVGLTMAAVMIYVINRRAFGWSLTMEVDPGTLLAGVGVSLGAALLAGLYPAYRMSRTSPAEALREE